MSRYFGSPNATQGYSLLYNGTDVAFNYKIGLASSVDGGATWAKYASNPVMSYGTSGQWDDISVVDPSVFWDGAQWVMYYAGYSGSAFAIGRATSPDLITWTKAGGNPVLTAAPTFTDVNFPTALLDGSLTRLWYTGWLSGGVTVIGYAEVLAGVLSGVGQVMGAGTLGAFDDSGLATGPVVKVGSIWYVFYAGLHAYYHTGYATCTDPDDLATYTKHGVLAAFSGDIVLSGVTYHSNQLRSIVTLGDGTYRGYGSAYHSGDGTEVSFTSTSADLVTWTTPTGPILALGGGAAWDSLSAENPVVVAT